MKMKLSYLYVTPQVYLDDGLGERVWVDRTDCKGFVENIQTAFDTRLPKSGLPGTEPFKTEPSSAGLYKIYVTIIEEIILEAAKGHKIHMHRLIRYSFLYNFVSPFVST